MSSLTEAFGPTEGHPWEKQENTQKYTYLASEYISPTPKRHILGLVGGNEVSVAEGTVVDVESDLRGINLPNTKAPWRKYQPPPVNQREIKRDNVKIKLNIDVSPMHRKPCAILEPEPILKGSRRGAQVRCCREWSTLRHGKMRKKCSAGEKAHCAQAQAQARA